MKRKLAKKIGIGAFILVVIITLINQVYVSTVLQNYMVYQQEEKYQEFLSNNSKRHIFVGVLGDSHPMQDVNPAFIPDSYNFATDGKKYGKTFVQLRKVLEQDGLAIDVLLFEIDLHTFSTNYDREPNWLNDLYLYKKWASYTELREIYSPDTQLYVESVFPSFAKGTDLFQLISPPYLREVHNGWVKNTNDFSLMPKEDRSVRIENLYDAVFVNKSRFSSTTTKYFFKTLNLAQKHNISIVFIRYPYSSEYSAHINQRGLDNDLFYNTIFYLINSSVSEYSVLNYYDYFSSFPNDSQFFADPDHLNEKGAEILSKQIASDIEIVRTNNRGK